MDRAELGGREGRRCAEVPRTGQCHSSCFTCLGKWAQGRGREGACSSENHFDSSCLKLSHLGPRGPLRTPQGFFGASKSLPWCRPPFHRHRPVSYSCLWKTISARQSSLTRRCLRLRFLGPFPDLQTLRRREWRLSSALASCGTGGPLAGGPTAEPCED